MSSSKPIKMDLPLEPSNADSVISNIDWRLVMTKNDDYFLHKLTLLSSDRGSDVIRKLIKRYEESQGRHMSWLIKAIPFMVPVVYTATLSPTPIEAISQSLPCIVDIKAKHRCHVFTHALRKPGYVPDTADFLTSYGRFAVVDEARGNTCARDALLVRLELNKTMLLVFAASSIILAVILGVLAAVCRQSLNIGFGVFGGIVGVIGVMEGALTFSLGRL
ncbi:hypothetical protein O1611_g2706 [Lasiodiplodia mahajangana]|uniref:Uncharacterized protein n=1 Tax=Lasiodiplodia mahajangana TaxID=1108764 RepID=A0ACC2JUC0_9PEZI|nr:hypothetical protein O1611_g2706 [Lasiodiplodia mahajangana]